MATTFDGNGTTDLIFNGSDYGYYGPAGRLPHPLSLAILSFGKDSFCVRDLNLKRYDDVAARLIRLDGKPYIQTIRLRMGLPSGVSGGTLRIVYDDGQTKQISDYGLCGTYGLSELEQLFYYLPETQHWVSADQKFSRCIDSLHSDAEVLGLIRTLDTDFPFLEYEPDTPVNAVPDYRERLQAFGQQRWQKGDIDGNGYTDLLFNGYMNNNGRSDDYSIIVFSFGRDSLLWHHISGANGFFAAKIIRYNGRDDVQINYLQAIADSTQPKGYHLTPCEDTLTASDGHLIELPSPVLHHIETARISAGGIRPMPIRPIFMEIAPFTKKTA